jgi:site-specific DNA-methyltransferase (adenine-specific)/modification methylase
MPKIGRVDAVVADPPYGVNGGSGTLGVQSLKTKYKASWDDTEDYIKTVVIPSILMCIKISDRAVITPGNPNSWHYPKPTDIGMIYQPATTSLGKWGRETSQPVLFYGKDPMSGKTIQAKHYVSAVRAEKNGHPCPKPIGVVLWLVSRASIKSESVLDPFMGSGTTGVACIQLGRKFIGIEIEPKYFEIAKDRIMTAWETREMDMFKDIDITIEGECEDES